MLLNDLACISWPLTWFRVDAPAYLPQLVRFTIELLLFLQTAGPSSCFLFTFSSQVLCKSFLNIFVWTSHSQACLIFSLTIKMLMLKIIEKYKEMGLVTKNFHFEGVTSIINEVVIITVHMWRHLVLHATTWFNLLSHSICASYTLSLWSRKPNCVVQS